MNHNDRDTIYENGIHASTIFFRMEKINVVRIFGNFLWVLSSRALPRWTCIPAKVVPVNNATLSLCVRVSVLKNFVVK